jgi:hypothetical protein
MSIVQEFTKAPVATCATVVGVVVSIFGFVFTYIGLKDASESLRAANTYSIQKDARYLMVELSLSKDFMLAIGEGPGEDLNKGRKELWKAFNFYLSVYRQAQSGGITESFSRSISRDFCDLLGRAEVSQFWDELVQVKDLGDESVRMRQEWCSGYEG